MKLSIIVPVYNEAQTIEELIYRLWRLKIDKEVVVVDDGSQDLTFDKLKKLKGELSGLKIIKHPQNLGKGAAIKTALKYVSGEIVVIQDADLEYPPEELPKLIAPIERGEAKIVFGSRFLYKSYPENMHLLNFIANKLFILFIRILYNYRLTDCATCYKLIPAETLNKLNLQANRFEFDFEVPAKLIKRGYSIYELPIRYSARAKRAGKKIGWLDALKAFYTLFKYRIIIN